MVLEGGHCATNSHEVQLATFVTSIPTDSRAMVDKAHPVHVEGEVEAIETVASVVPWGRGRPSRPQVAANLQPIAQRFDMLEDTVLNRPNMMTQLVATMTNAQAALALAIARPFGGRHNSVGREDQASAQAAHSDRATQHPRNSEALHSRTRGESQRTRTSVFNRLGAKGEDKKDST